MKNRHDPKSLQAAILQIAPWSTVALVVGGLWRWATFGDMAELLLYVVVLGGLILWANFSPSSNPPKGSGGRPGKSE